MSASTAAARAAESAGATIRPFRIQVPEADLDDLRDRLARTRWPDELPDAGRDYGVPLDYVQDLTDYWRRDYDWRAHEARLNQFPQFTTSIDGEPLHYLHVRSPEPRALPLLITYGWPSSIVDFWHVIEPLTDPDRHGGDPADAFDVVLPSLPGFGFSGPTHDTGWDLGRHTAAMAELMRRLGYQRYGAHGGDFGSLISPALGRLDRDRVVGVHLVGLLTQPPRDPDELRSLTDFERERVEKVTRWMWKGRGYALIQATRPQTLAYGLSDSPVGLLAWLTAPFTEYSDPNMPPDRDQLLSNVMLYWLTGTVGSSSRLFKETGRDLASARNHPPCPPAWRYFPTTRCCQSEVSSNGAKISCTGRSSTGAVTSPPRRYPTCSSATCARSSADSGDGRAASRTHIEPSSDQGVKTTCLGFYRRRTNAACCEAENHDEGLKP